MRRCMAPSRSIRVATTLISPFCSRLAQRSVSGRPAQAPWLNRCSHFRRRRAVLAEAALQPGSLGVEASRSLSAAGGGRLAMQASGAGVVVPSFGELRNFRGSLRAVCGASWFARCCAVRGVELPGACVAAMATGAAGAVDPRQRVAGECRVHRGGAAADAGDEPGDGAVAAVPVAGPAHGVSRRGCRPVISATCVISSWS
jgi:hypothetical protein